MSGVTGRIDVAAGQAGPAGGSPAARSADGLTATAAIGYPPPAEDVLEVVGAGVGLGDGAGGLVGGATVGLGVGFGAVVGGAVVG